MRKMQELKDIVNGMSSPRRLLVLAEEVKDRINELLDHKSRASSVGNYAEWLTTKVYGGKIEDSASQSGHDVIDGKGRKIQVKSRVIRDGRNNLRTSVKLQNIEGFDYLIFITFLADSYKIQKVFSMSKEAFQSASKVSPDMSVWSITSHDNNFENIGVKDVTADFKCHE